MTVHSKLPVMLSDIEDIDIKYENGCIYILKHKTDETKEYYIGSTINFKSRCKDHKSACNNENRKNYNLKVYKYIRDNDGWNYWKIIKLYDYPCKNKYKLELEEQRVVKEYKSTLNHSIPCRTLKEYYEDNKEKKIQQQKEYRKDNKEKLSQQNKEYRKNNKEIIAQKKKEYQQNNKEKIAQRSKEYSKNNKEIIAQRKKEYQQNNKEKIAKKQAIKINCDICNAIVCKGVIARHKKSLKCMNYQKLIVQ